jgi:hypothetical protein
MTTIEERTETTLAHQILAARGVGIGDPTYAQQLDAERATVRQVREHAEAAQDAAYDAELAPLRRQFDRAHATLSESARERKWREEERPRLLSARLERASASDEQNAAAHVRRLWTR